ncbi:MAG: glutamine-hydrolyzing carbamoyl-phosphate synthase small subunit [Chlamydiales bacterium]
MIAARLILQTGESFEGTSPTWQDKPFFGEVVFTTGMTGYVETLTDPSYAGQIIVFTYPLIGNYGVPLPSEWESEKIHAHGVVVNISSERFHHHAAEQSFLDWLKKQNVALLSGVDTRALTKRLRMQGVSQGVITSGSEKLRFATSSEHLVAKVSRKKPAIYGKGKKKIIAVDCGMKENILRCLLKHAWEIKRVPFDYDYTHEEWDGVFLSNGPGDPTLCTETITILKKAMKRKKPIFGICLGAQLMALALGSRTYKLRYGHRGQNQPCLHLETKRSYLTSQNHGYAIDEKSLPKEWRVSFRNLNDQTVEGIEHINLPFSAVQFHPEGAPGPVDTEWLFEKFYAQIYG